MSAQETMLGKDFSNALDVADQIEPTNGLVVGWDFFSLTFSTRCHHQAEMSRNNPG
jgi:hypothetical protein